MRAVTKVKNESNMSGKNDSSVKHDAEAIRKDLSTSCFAYHGDFLDVKDLIEPGSIDMVFADPPYNLSNDGFTCKSGRAHNVNKGDWDRSNGFEEDFRFHNAWIAACRDLLSEDGTLWVSGTYHSIYLCGTALQQQGFHILNDICWFKPNASPNLSCRMFAAAHETLIWARKNPKGKHEFNYELMKNMDFPKDSLKNPGKQMRSVWVIPTPSKREKTFGNHPTQKPLDLLTRILLSSSKKGSLILDPFMGSGTTGVAAVRYGRRFIGVEKDDAFFDLAIKRLGETCAEQDASLFARMDSEEMGLADGEND